MTNNTEIVHCATVALLLVMLFAVASCSKDEPPHSEKFFDLGSLFNTRPYYSNGRPPYYPAYPNGVYPNGGYPNGGYPNGGYPNAGGYAPGGYPGGFSGVGVGGGAYPNYGTNIIGAGGGGAGFGNPFGGGFGNGGVPPYFYNGNNYYRSEPVRQATASSATSPANGVAGHRGYN